MGDNKEFNDFAIFWGVLLIVGGLNFYSIEDSSLVVLGYQLLPLATSKIMGDNKEFDDLAIFWGVFLIVGGGKPHNIEDSSLDILGYQLLPLATSEIMGDNKQFNDSVMFYSFLQGNNESLMFSDLCRTIRHGNATGR